MVPAAKPVSQFVSLVRKPQTETTPHQPRSELTIVVTLIRPVQRFETASESLLLLSSKTNRVRNGQSLP